jgi:Family of unknown function (DUF5681)
VLLGLLIPLSVGFLAAMELRTPPRSAVAVVQPLAETTVGISEVKEQKRSSGLRPWKPGVSGNPAGRPIGSRNKLSESVIQDIAVDWAIGGPETIARVRMTDPATYFRVVASILPKDVLVNVQQSTPGNLEPESWATLRRVLDIIQVCAPAGAEPAAVFETIENALRMEYAKPVEST